MHIKTLEIGNFRAIRNVKFSHLDKLIVIAGPNGCGKSTIFDAIRLMKSVYGGYQQNEIHQWFSEFQINLNRPQNELWALLQDKSKPLEISFEIELEDDEKNYLDDNLEEILSPRIWAQLAPDSGGTPYSSSLPLAAQLRQFSPEFEKRQKAENLELKKLLKKKSYFGQVVIDPRRTPGIFVKKSLMLEIVFSQFQPKHIGIIDFHGSQRTYAREKVGGINLRLDEEESRNSQHALYNYANKYSNIQSEMATHYVQKLIAEDSGASHEDYATLVDSLKELFSTFFPGKQFGGARPTTEGKVLFPVKTFDDLEHEINELSSGEKEVLYGYLRIFNLSPRNSVILIDEPELHLNPRLVKGLPQFYHEHLGKPLNNQIWLLTHSDALLRESLETEQSSVFHMVTPDISIKDNQIKPVVATDDLNKAIISLVGNLATYIPGAKVIVLEGGGDSEFDAELISQLFPEFAAKVNLISGGNKRMVGQLFEILQKAKDKGAIPMEIFSIVDKDSDSPFISSSSNHRAMEWDVYHIENYLIDFEIIYKVAKRISGAKSVFSSVDQVELKLKEAAKEVIPHMVKDKLVRHSNNVLINAVSIGGNPDSASLVDDIHNSIQGSVERFNVQAKNELRKSDLEALEKNLIQDFQNDLASGEWRYTIRGRDILKKFVSKNFRGIAYEVFAQLLITEMRESQFKPTRMKTIINQILTRD